MINSRTGIFANSLHKIFLFVSPPFYLTCSCTCGEPEKSPPPSAWLIFSPSIARIDFSDPPPNTQKSGTLLPASSHVGIAPSAASWLCHLPLHSLCWCGMNPDSAPSISTPGGTWGGDGKPIAKGRAFLSLTARDAALLRWGQHQLSNYFKDFAEKTFLQVRRTIAGGEDLFNLVWECYCVQALGSDCCHIQTGFVTFTATPARCCTLTGWCCK